MNRKFGKLEGTEPTYAPDMLTIDGVVHHNPSSAAYLAAGWLAVSDTAPSVPSGSYARPTGWAIEDGKVVRQYEVVTPDPTPRTFSKLKCYAALKAAGYWPTVKAWLEKNDLWDAFVLAQDVREDNEQFAAGLAALKSAIGLTDEQAETILANCVAEVA